jgi:hypothetical protein
MRIDGKKYLGCIHPRWANLFYVYCGLPMGAGNSPSISDRYGAAFQQLIRSCCPLFQGTPSHNTWWGVYQNGTPYNSHLGQGQVLIGADGEPAVLLRRGSVLGGPLWDILVLDQRIEDLYQDVD